MGKSPKGILKVSGKPGTAQEDGNVPPNSFWTKLSQNIAANISQYRRYWLAASVSLASFLVYLPSLQNGFVNWDDSFYVYENPYIRSLDRVFLKWSFLEFYSYNWHPLTWLSHALDYRIWGLNPAGHHLTNIIFHALNTAIVILIITRLLAASKKIAESDGISQPLLSDDMIMIIGAITGLLFGLHPIHVESVAWISERKDLLCAFFFLLGILMYIEYLFVVRNGQYDGNSVSRFLNRQYLLALVSFALALLSKPMAVTLPAVLLILDWYPFRRMRSFKLTLITIAEKIPYIVLSLISSIITVMAQKAGGAIQSSAVFPLSSRALVAVESILVYIRKLVFPIDLVPYYPYPAKVSLFSFEYVSMIILTLTITAVFLVMAKRHKVLLAAWIYYLVTLVPVLGIVQVGAQAMADRYTYLPSIGPFCLIGILAAWISAKTDVKEKGRLLIKSGSTALAILAIVFLSYLTVKQISIWHSSIELWNYVIANEPGRVPIAYMNRGAAFEELGQWGKAADDYSRAVALDPFDPDVYYERGRVLAELGQFNGALASYDSAIALIQYGATSLTSRDHYFLMRGLAQVKLGQVRSAILDFKKACDLGNQAGCNNMQYYGAAGTDE